MPSCGASPIGAAVADPADPAGAPGPAVPGLAEPAALGLERFSIRTRESSVTQAGWRLSVVAREGAGAIVLVEIPGGSAVHRGDGVFLGWSQERLAAAFAALTPKDTDPPFETAQLG
jgi:hypothetical protein